MTFALAAGALLATAAWAGKTPAPRTAEDEFGRDVELAPFVVRGEQLAVSIYARSARDRKYAEGFAEDVIKVVYEAVTERTGKGLVIVGARGEPHPITIFRKFEAMASAGQLDPEVAASVGELHAFLEAWRTAMNQDAGRGEAQEAADLDIDFEEIINALPLPLQGVGARLYQIAWAERFDDARVTTRFRALKVDELRRDLFVRFDWVFYLPPRGAFDRVINEIIAQALKKEDMGFFSRMAVRTVLTVVKPMIRRGIEGMRKGMLFMTVVRARTEYADEQVSALAAAYVETLMPGAERKRDGSEHERAVWAVRDAKDHLRPAARSHQSGSSFGEDLIAVGEWAGAESPAQDE